MAKFVVCMSFHEENQAFKSWHIWPQTLFYPIVLHKQIICLNWSMRVVCTTCCGVCKCSCPLLTHTLFFCLLRFPQHWGLRGYPRSSCLHIFFFFTASIRLTGPTIVHGVFLLTGCKLEINAATLWPSHLEYVKI